MLKTREHAGEGSGKVGRLILPDGNAHGLIVRQVAVGVEHQRGHLRPQSFKRVLRERYA